MPKSTKTTRDNAGERQANKGISLRLRGGWREAVEAYGEALSLAEAGETDLAREILGVFHAEHRKIMVLAEEDGVPEAMVTYSVNLAERLGFDLVLLTVGTTNRRGSDFEAWAKEAGQPLLLEAERRGVHCAHILRQGQRDDVLNAVSLELRRVEFVITRRPETERKHAALMVPEFSLKC